MATLLLGYTNVTGKVWSEGGGMPTDKNQGGASVKPLFNLYG